MVWCGSALMIPFRALMIQLSHVVDTAIILSRDLSISARAE